ncbi:zinc metalloprotease HtpX [Methanofollis fontis]|uniref:Protease HtpX homolog n=1 Tax=Methanofollis fontis TaxID=2052832 RepID=A0A483CQN2_9EURY|nr:zinc metalloprotease HtpX [Methanofollis fontis]TAJ43264.1 zinc metalloprotease HtpX [Methanofollis fontis]
MARWHHDRGLQWRMGVTLILLMFVYLVFITVLAYIGVETLFLLAIVAVMLFFQYYFSDRMVLWSMGARVVTEEEEPRLYQVITRLCAVAGMTRPRIAIVNTTVPNAFATGRNPRNAVVAVTTGLVNRLEPEELEAVIAHELSHVKNRDVMVITLASFLSTAAFFIFRNWFFFGASPRSDRNSYLWWILPLVALAVWITSYLLIQALSRYREFSADRGSAVITGHPSHLASALMKISGQMERLPTEDLRKVEGMNAFFIIPAVSGSTIFHLFATHPPVEQRIAALEQIEREMGG